MAQVTLYLDEETAARLKKAARAAGLSQSRWLAQVVRQRTAEEWPEAFKRLLGSWTDIPDARRLRRVKGRDVKRERL